MTGKNLLTYFFGCCTISQVLLTLCHGERMSHRTMYEFRIMLQVRDSCTKKNFTDTRIETLFKDGNKKTQMDRIFPFQILYEFCKFYSREKSTNSNLIIQSTPQHYNMLAERTRTRFSKLFKTFILFSQCSLIHVSKFKCKKITTT